MATANPPNSNDRGRDDAPINPYASPTIPGGYELSSTLGIGAWRDGDILVLHKQASLPFVCIETGDPGFRYRTFVLDRNYWLELWMRQEQLLLPLGKPAYRKFRNREIMATAAIVVPIFALMIVTGIRGALAPAWYFPLIGLFMCGLVFAEILRRKDRKRLRFVAKKDSYVWIAGADPRFLAHLPDWPLSGAT
jgi:hypothetical protein